MDAPPDPNPAPAPPPTASAPSTISAEDRQWGMFCHLSSFVGYVIPFGNVVGPLVLWLMKRETMPFVEGEGKESVNFQISVTIYAIISAILSFFCIGFVLLIALLIFDLIVVIMACIESSKGNAYKYPLCIRFIQ